MLSITLAPAPAEPLQESIMASSSDQQTSRPLEHQQRQQDRPANSALLVSPRKLRRIAQSTLMVPEQVHRVTLPDARVVTMGELLSWHCSQLVQKGRLSGARRVMREKGPLSFGVVASMLMKDPLADVHGGNVHCDKRHLGARSAAKVYAVAYRVSVRDARHAMASKWQCADIVIRNNWAALTTHADYKLAADECRDPAQEDAADSEAYGCLFTWQTSIGRADDTVRMWVSRGIGGDVLCDLMSGEPSLKNNFEVFCKWLAAQTKELGFRYWAAAMETNQSGGEAVVHLHAYVCVDWRNRGTSRWMKCKADPEHWQYGGFAPDARYTILKGNVDAKKLMSGGLFYCSAKKVGSVFQMANAVPGKDRCARSLCMMAS